MSAFASWLLGFAKTFLVWMYNHGITFFQGALDGFVTFVLGVVALFPSATDMPSLPTLPESPTFTAFVGALNWIFPVAFFVQLTAIVVTALVAYLTIAPLARWLKLLN